MPLSRAPHRQSATSTLVRDSRRIEARRGAAADGAATSRRRFATPRGQDVAVGATAVPNPPSRSRARQPIQTNPPDQVRRELACLGQTARARLHKTLEGADLDAPAGQAKSTAHVDAGVPGQARGFPFPALVCFSPTRGSSPHGLSGRLISEFRSWEARLWQPPPPRRTARRAQGSEQNVTPRN